MNRLVRLRRLVIRYGPVSTANLRCRWRNRSVPGASIGFACLPPHRADEIWYNEGVGFGKGAAENDV